MSVSNDPYTPPLFRSLCIQFGLLLFFALLLDGGVLLRTCGYASVGFWAGVALILLRRPASPTLGDLKFIRNGLVPIVALVMPMFLLVWHLKGIKGF